MVEEVFLVVIMESFDLSWNAANCRDEDQVNLTLLPEVFIAERILKFLYPRPSLTPLFPLTRR